MPNWCSTRVEITGDVNKIFRLEQNINEWSQTDVVENGFVRWLGNVVQNSGIGSYDDYSCRGYITDMYSCVNNEDKTASLCIYTDTAWVPMLDMWFDIVAKYIPEAELQYSAEEPGNEIYVTNMPEYDGKYIFDILNQAKLIINTNPNMNYPRTHWLKFLQTL